MSVVSALMRRRRFTAACGLSALPSLHALAGAPALAWPTVELIDGRVLTPQHWHGAAAIVVFWATWCAFCKRHNTRLDRLHAALGGRGPRILGVAIDGDAASVARFVAAQGWRFPVALDDGSLRPQFTERRTVPMTCVLDAAGVIRQRIPGEMTDDNIQALGRSA